MLAAIFFNILSSLLLKVNNLDCTDTSSWKNALDVTYKEPENCKVTL